MANSWITVHLYQLHILEKINFNPKQKVFTCYLIFFRCMISLLRGLNETVKLTMIYRTSLCILKWLFSKMILFFRSSCVWNICIEAMLVLINPAFHIYFLLNLQSNAINYTMERQTRWCLVTSLSLCLS